MSINDVSRVSSTLNGDPARFIPQVTRGLREQSGMYRLFQAMEKLAAAGKAKTVRGQILRAFESHPFITNPIVTIAASVGDTVLNLTDTRFLVRDIMITDPLSNKQIRVTADPNPIDGGVVSVTALEAAIPVGTNVISSVQVLPEGYQRMTPRSRSLEHFDEAVGVVGTSISQTLHSIHYEQYTGDEEDRLQRQKLNEFARAINNYLYTSQFSDGTVTGNGSGITHPRGLIQRAMETNRHVIDGELHIEDIQDILYPIWVNRESEEPPSITIMCSQGLINATALAPLIQPGFQTKQGDSTIGVSMPKLTNAMGIPMSFAPDVFFDQSPEYKNLVLLVDFSQLYPINFGLNFEEGPTQQNPQGVADRGSGVRQWQVIKSVGMGARTQYYAALALPGVTRITY